MDTDAQDCPLAVVAAVASAGGVEALSALARTLPADFPAAVLVLLHVSESGPSILPSVLARRCALRVAHARNGERLRRGRVQVAPPGLHLRVRDGVVELDAGPRENRHRPSADALLRSLADAWGPRAAGIVLSGTMDDGAAGLRTLGAAGGLTMVQDPEEATFPGMPLAAIAEAKPSVVCAVRDMAGHLIDWMALFDGTSGPGPDPHHDFLPGPGPRGGTARGDAPRPLPQDREGEARSHLAADRARTRARDRR